MSEPIHHLPKQIDESADKNHFYETLWKRVGLELLIKHAGPCAGMTILDYGCGRGETIGIAKELGFEASGADIDPECVALSSSYGQAMTIEEPHDPAAQFGRKSFDIVSCFHVLEHIDRLKETLTSLGKIARQYVIVAIPNLRSLPKPRFMMHESNPVNEGHLHGWDHAHFRNLAERHCGLRLVAWGHDHVRVPILSGLASKVGGDSLAIRLETGPFLKLFKFHSTSVIALLEVI